jgi:hypothetical protein
MREYWSCSKFADWLRGSRKLSAGTSKEWYEWTKASKESNPIRYWLAEEGLDYLENIWLYIPNRINDVRYYINNRWVHQTHGMYASSLTKGKWHEFDTRLLHSMFDQLVDFVEIDQAWHYVVWNDEEQKKYNVPYWRKQWWTRWFSVWRCPEAGLAYLEWAKTLTNAEFLEEDKKHLAVPTGQAETAIELLKLYRWWKEERPKRPDPYDVSGWSALCEKRRETHKEDGWLWQDRSAAEKKESRNALKVIAKLEEQYEKEDEAMMIRLIKIRKGLWT